MLQLWFKNSEFNLPILTDGNEVIYSLLLFSSIIKWSNHSGRGKSHLSGIKQQCQLQKRFISGILGIGNRRILYEK